MSEQNTVCSEFTRAVENVEKEITFNTDWTNGYNGYWNGAVMGLVAPSLADGEVVKTMDDFGHRAIFIGSKKGNIVLFDRYRPTDGVFDGQINYQVPRDYKLIWFFGGSGACDETKFFQLVNPMNPSENVGSALAD